MHGILFNSLLVIAVAIFSDTNALLVRAFSRTRLSQSNINQHERVCFPQIVLQESAKSSESDLAPYTNLSSSYARDIPAALVGEAVRSALRSDRGVCFDFSKDRYKAGSSEGRLVSVVKIQGKGVKSFLNAKFSQSVPSFDTHMSSDVRNDVSSKKLESIRRGCAFETGYLTSKGRIIDRLLVLAFLNAKDIPDDCDEAFLITSPGNCGTALYNELAPFVFPMDQIILTDLSPSSINNVDMEPINSGEKTSIITIASARLNDARTSFRKNILEFLTESEPMLPRFNLPNKGMCDHYSISNGSQHGDIFIIEHTFLPREACHGYTILLRESGMLNTLIWNKLTNKYNDAGPVGLGSLEYETLRIEAGLPGFGFEMTGDGANDSFTMKQLINNEGLDSKSNVPLSSSVGEKNEKYYSKANPLELHLQNLIDNEKGCYKGQEGVASMLKNKSGFPRMLYHVVFFNSENDFEGSESNSDLLSLDNKKLLEFQQLKKHAIQITNHTRQPRPGDSLYVLGSNGSIKVGTISSVAQPNGTGEAITVALALVRRSKSVLDAIKESGLELPRWWEEENYDEFSEQRNIMKHYRSAVPRDEKSSGMLPPPPLDALHNLEVVIGDTYTMGRLRSVPSRRYGYTQNNDFSSLLDYERRGEVVNSSSLEQMNVISGESKVIREKLFPADKLKVLKESNNINKEDEKLNEDLLEAVEKEANKAEAKAEVLAAEAQRKAEKMKSLKEQAEAAMLARRKKKETT